MSAWRVRGGKALSGTITPPPDKSISHRALILGALADGVTEIENLLEGEDCLSTAGILRALGIQVSGERGRWTVRGGALAEPSVELDAGNSGTTMRLIAGVLAGQPFRSVLVGDESLSKRPMLRVVEPLREMGAEIGGREGGRFAPLTIRGGHLHGICYNSSVASAQLKSCILLAGLFAEGITQVTEPSLSRDHTERMLGAFGVTVSRSGMTVAVVGKHKLHGAQVEVPGDFSSAAFPLVAGLIVPGSRVGLENVGFNWTRIGLAEVLTAAGASLTMGDPHETCCEPAVSLQATHSTLCALSAGGSLVPRLVDEVPVFAVAATQASGESLLTDASELRVKESDRLQTITDELRKMGADMAASADGLVIHGPTPLHCASVESRGDHRIAMSLAVAGLAASGETTVNDVECVRTSFPGFVPLMRSLGADIDEI